jgi:hypothetical protein
MAMTMAMETTSTTTRVRRLGAARWLGNNGMILSLLGTLFLMARGTATTFHDYEEHNVELRNNTRRGE